MSTSLPAQVSIPVSWNGYIQDYGTLVLTTLTFLTLPLVVSRYSKSRKPQCNLQEITTLVNSADLGGLKVYFENHDLSQGFLKKCSNHILLTGIIGGVQEVIELLVGYGFRPQPSQADPVVLAADLSNTILLELFISKGCSQKSIDNSLIPAILKNKLEIAKILLNKGANPHIMRTLESSHMAHLLISPEMETLLARYPELVKRLAILHFKKNQTSRKLATQTEPATAMRIMQDLPAQFTKEILEYV